MTTREALALYLRYGSRLDGYATRITMLLRNTLHVEGVERLDEIAKEESRHARMQAEMAAELNPIRMSNEVYTETVGNMALTDDPTWNAIWMNVGEMLFAVQFRMIGRRARELGFPFIYHGLSEIAKDEERHVRLGWEHLRQLNLRTGVIQTVGRVMEVVNQSDEVITTTIPIVLGLPSLVGLARKMARRVEDQLC